MARVKYDGVVEAVRYTPEGPIEIIRVYERRGPAFSDRILLTRQQLIDRIRAGQKYVIGQRLKFMAGTFETGPAVIVAGPKDSPVLVTDGTSKDGAERDLLQGVPVF